MTRIEIVTSNTDLLLHFAVFFLASLILVASGLSRKFYGQTRHELQYKLAWVVPMLLLAIITELVQTLIPGRVPDPVDLLFNLGGIACAACLVGLYYEMAPVVRAYHLRERRWPRRDRQPGLAKTDTVPAANTSPVGPEAISPIPHDLRRQPGPAHASPHRRPARPSQGLDLDPRKAQGNGRMEQQQRP